MRTLSTERTPVSNFVLDTPRPECFYKVPLVSSQSHMWEEGREIVKFDLSPFCNHSTSKLLSPPPFPYDRTRKNRGNLGGMEISAFTLTAISAKGLGLLLDARLWASLRNRSTRNMKAGFFPSPDGKALSRISGISGFLLETFISRLTNIRASRFYCPQLLLQHSSKWLWPSLTNNSFHFFDSAHCRKY